SAVSYATAASPGLQAGRIHRAANRRRPQLHRAAHGEDGPTREGDARGPATAVPLRDPPRFEDQQHDRGGAAGALAPRTAREALRESDRPPGWIDRSA